MHDKSNKAPRGDEFAKPLADGLKSVRERIDRMGSSTQEQGVLTGFLDLDRITFGFHRNSLTLLAGAVGVGVSALLAQLVIQAAAPENETKRNVLVYSLGMSMESFATLATRLCARIGERAWNEWTMDHSQFERIAPAMEEVGKLGVSIDDSIVPVDELAGRARRLDKQLTKETGSGIGIIFVNYLQLLPSSSKSPSFHYPATGETCQTLKKLAEKLDVPIVAAFPFTQTAMRLDGHYNLGDIVAAGVREADVDSVIIMERDGYVSSNGCERTELFVAKQRNGPTGSVSLAYNTREDRFDEWEFAG